MKLNTCFSAALSAVLMVSAISLGGCAGMTPQDQGTATGAVIGGVLGNVLCGGGLACTGGGAAVGGVIGHEVSK